MMNIIDLSHVIRNEMQIYPGDPAPTIERCLVHETDYCHVDRLNLGSHTGTHIDAPLHFLKDGKTISDFPASFFISRGIVVDVTDLAGDVEIGLERLKAYDDVIEEGMFILLMSGWDAYWGMEQYLSHPYLSPDAARYIVEKGVRIVGTDALNIDSTQKEVFAAHDILLSVDVLIVENLCGLKQIPAGETPIISFLPLKVEGTDGSPVRAVAILG